MENLKNRHSSQINDTRWKAKAKEIKQRDKVCQKCGAKYGLDVHHKLYIYGRDLWDYPDDYLITICRSCHEEETIFGKEIKTIIDNAKLMLFNKELYDKIKHLDVRVYRCSQCGQVLDKEHVEAFGGRCFMC